MSRVVEKQKTAQNQKRTAGLTRLLCALDHKLVSVEDTKYFSEIRYVYRSFQALVLTVLYAFEVRTLLKADQNKHDIFLMWYLQHIMA